MKIVHLIARLNDGGPARVVANLAREFGHRGHDVRIITGETTPDEPSLTERFVEEGLAIEVMPGLGRSIAPRNDLAAAIRLRGKLKTLNPDVVHTHTAKAGMIGRMVCRFLGIPVVHTYHGHVLDGYFSPTQSAIVRAAERFAGGQAHHHALTRSQFMELHGQYGIGSIQRWHILPVPVQPIAKFAADWHTRLAASRPVIGFVGRLTAVKDGALFLDALAALDRIRPVQGLICGDGVQRAELEERAAALGVPVLFTGYVPAGEAFGAIDVLLMTSRNEGMPLVAVEAGSCGVPVVAPPVGGLVDLGEAGAVVLAERTAEGLAQACAGLFADASLRDASVAAGAKFASGCRPAALAASYEAMYAQVCNR